MLRGLLERVLKAQIRNALHIDDEYRILLFISARSAMLSFFQGLDLGGRPAKVMVQDFICSSVPMAIEKAGGVELQTYPLDEALVPDPDRLTAQMREFKPDVVVLAPILGAQGERYSELMVNLAGSHDRPILLLDEAQYMDPLPCRMDAVILSFHGKSVNGLNGGALLLHRDFKSYNHGESATVKPNDEWYLALILRERRWQQRHRPKVETDAMGGYVFDSCEYFPGRLESTKMPLVSILVAMMEMLRLGHYRRVREANFEALRSLIEGVPGAHVVATENVSSASHFVVRAGEEATLHEVAERLAGVRLGLKPAYSRHDDPSSSARPELYMVENPFHRLDR